MRLIAQNNRFKFISKIYAPLALGHAIAYITITNLIFKEVSMLMSTYESRLHDLRQELKRRELTAFVVPICDEHMSEYVGEYAQRLSWLTGFGGSAGSAIVMADKAAIFTDGRYTIQVRDQVDGQFYEYVSVAETSLVKWIEQNMSASDIIGYDPWLHTSDWVKQAQAAAKKSGASLLSLESNPIDSIWSDQPKKSDTKLSVHSHEYAGKTSADKRADMAQWMQENDLDACVIAALDSVAWTFNIRGGDVSNTPVPLSFALVHKDGQADFFVAPEKMTDEVREHLGNQVRVQDYNSFTEALSTMQGKAIGVDPERSVSAIFSALEKANIVKTRDPAVLAKAIKNDTEQAGTRAAHIRDGTALSKFLRWASIEAPKGGHDELSLAAKLREFREETGVLKDLSFRTISATGPHGALCHYSVDESSNIAVENGHLYLVDSGGQYLDGTTDVTRVLAIGEPTDEMRMRYTQVLKGHIALGNAVFPKGTTGGQLDVLARQYLWTDGVDYAHGTGHGVGSFLAVHEGPQRIALSAGTQAGTGEALQIGMILSNEPGYYKANEYGIRIENLVLVQEAKIDGAEGDYMCFENLTFAPLEPRLIDLSLLTQSEIDWVNDYHAEVVEKIAPLLSGDDLTWLREICAPMSDS